MRDRLIELFRKMDKNPEITCPNPTADGEACKTCKYAISEWLCDMEARKVDYLLASGVIVPPCKVGDTVYVVDGVTDDVVIGVITHLEYNIFTTPREWITVRGTYPFFGEHDFKDRIDLLIGKTVFLTKEEAERALKEREKE